MSAIKKFFGSQKFKALLYLVFGAWAFFLGRYHTLYSLGASVVFTVFVISLLAGAVSMFIFKTNTSSRGLNITLNIGTSIFVFFVVAYYIDNYKPTVKIKAPEGFEGCVYLFYSDDEINEVVINSNGIGYIEFGKNAVYDFYVGDEKNNEVLKTSGYNQVMTFNDDTTWSTSIRVGCYELNKENIYQKEYPYVQPSCLEWDEFTWMVKQGLVDSSKVQIYRRKFEPIELLQRKRNREFRIFWPTNLQTGEVGDMGGKAISQKIYAYFKFKYDTISPKVFENEINFSQQFVKGIKYSQKSSSDSCLNILIRLPKTNLGYTKKAFSSFFREPQFQFNGDSSLYFITKPISANTRKYKFSIKEKKDSVFVKIAEPILLQ